ncbi:hypothetical protein EFS38_00030 [Dickeya undicola]|uniref:Uncharacterized protein n=1 Tax=Dickeya undicola TaxID=1577887 RepID=A0A3N0FVH4_9GAMM|nr:hypothetical protein EF878_17040 [Dickeya undicola]RNM28462.1 hypothetical protein EFS38_00030 [Dickeya undicola]
MHFFCGHLCEEHHEKVRKTHFNLYTAVIYSTKLPFPFKQLSRLSLISPPPGIPPFQYDFRDGERSHYGGFIHRQPSKTSQKIGKTSKTTVSQGCKLKQ